MSNPPTTAQSMSSPAGYGDNYTGKPAVRRQQNPTTTTTTAIAAVEKKAGENWMAPMQVLLAGLVAAVLVALVFYYTVTVMLSVAPAGTQQPTAKTGLFTASNWLTIGGGSFFFVIIAVLLGAAGATMGMSWRRNGDAAMWAMGSTLLLGLVYYFVFASANDGRKDQFAFWSFLATIAAIAIPGYGWWQMKGLVADLKTNEKEYNDADKKAIPMRGTWSMITFGVSVSFALIAAAGFYKIYGAME